jgi:outer membrane protein OmpA-like peptidoglycan-associated protein
MRRVAKKSRIRNYPLPRRASFFRAQVCVVLFFAMLLCVTNGSLFAQDQKPSFFVGASFADNKSFGTLFDAYEGVTPCGVYSVGSKPGWSGIAGVSFPFKNPWSLEGALLYRDLSTNFNAPVTSITGLDPLISEPGVGYVSGVRERYFDASLSMISLSATLSYELFPRLKISAGPYAGVFLKHSYTETEGLLSPGPPAVFAGNHERTDTIASNASLGSMTLLQFGLSVGASYELPFQPNIALRPSVGWIIPFTSLTSGYRNLGWISSIGASLELVYHLSEPPVQEPAPVIVSEMPKPTLQVHAAETPPIVSPKRTMLSVSVKALGVGDDGREVSEPVISIERTHVTEVYPMLHYVFFDDGSSEIPERYHRETAATRNAFREKDLFTANALEIHHHVLDILGSRLAANPDASVTLVGTRSEHSPNDSLFGSVISMDRAKSVQDYLAKVWGIDRERLRLRERALPDIASDDHNPFGQAENRRVEIIPSSPEITAPLRTERIERVATPPRIDFEPEITANAGIRTATITVYQHGHILRTIDALSDSAASEYLWTIDDRSMPDDAPEASDSLRYVFSAIDSLGDTAEASGIIHLRKQTSDLTHHAGDTTLGKQLDRYSLILFDYSSSQLDKKESDLIVKEMASAIRGEAHVTLTGHTDKTGDEAFNDRLARDRVTRAAQMLEAALKKLGEKIPPLAIESRGSRDNLFDNSIPEGRVLSRTVRATIENEVK